MALRNSTSWAESRLHSLNSLRHKITKRIITMVDKRPLTSFFVVLAALFLIIAIGSFLRKPKTAGLSTEPPPKAVQVYNIGAAPKITVNAQIEKSGIVKITAQTPGIVSQLNVAVGQQVTRGTNLLSLASNYAGTNPAIIQSQIASLQYKNVQDTYQTQKDLIGKQRELADKNRENTDKLRDITSQALGETRGIISYNDSVISQLQDLLTAQTPGTQTYISTEEQISQFKSANNQLRQALRNSEFQVSTDNAPNKISEIQTDIAKKQLDLQEKSLALSLETSRLQAALASVNAENFHPTSPFAGTVERVHVVISQSVLPGTVLVTIAGADKTATAQAFVPRSIATNISKLTPATLHMDSETADLLPIYISQEATEGQLYSVVFAIPEDFQNNTTDRSIITVDLPLDTTYGARVDPLIPIDAVHQTQDEAFVFVVKDQSAEAKKVHLGEVQGNYIQIIKGLNTNDKVIINRNIIAGDKVEVKN